MKTLMRDQTLLLPGHGYSASAEAGHELINLRGLGIMAVPAGGDRGYNTEGDVLTQTVDGRNLNDVWREFQASLGMYNETRQRLIDLLTFPVTSPIEDVPIITGDDFEEASEFGEPKGLRGGDFHSFGYDFKWYDLAIRYTWKYLAEATSAQVESLNAMAMEADNRLLFNKVMKAVFDNRTRTADIRSTPVNVYPFYNGDAAAAPPNYKNYTFDDDHNHYLTTGASEVTSGDLDTMATHIRHHGHGTASSGGQMLLLVPEDGSEVAKIRTFRVADGDSYDFIPSQGSPPFLMPQTQGVQGGQPPAQFQGMNVAGRYGPWLVIEESYIPANYMVGLATGGEVAATNPVGIREHANPGLRGLRLVKGRDNDYPLIDSFYNRGFGTGVRQRGAGVVSQVTANAEYAIPSQYAD
jgi:hypothetical protein